MPVSPYQLQEMRMGSWVWESYLTDQKLTMLWGAEGMGHWTDSNYVEANSEENRFPLFFPWGEEKA